MSIKKIKSGKVVVNSLSPKDLPQNLVEIMKSNWLYNDNIDINTHKKWAIGARKALILCRCLDIIIFDRPIILILSSLSNECKR